MKDLFSNHASEYAQFRPSYPPALYELIAQHVRSKNRAWDCATGNGQAAVDLAAYFNEVIATDMSANQIAHAVSRPNITYLQCAAEETPFPDNHFDLITVAQAYHWFDHNRFHQEVSRVGKPGSVVAIWGYGLIQSTHPAVNEKIEIFYRDVLGSYWDEERRHVDDHYRSLSFPYQEISSTELPMHKEYAMDHLLRYLNTWSAVQKYHAVNHINPLDDFAITLSHVWPSSERFDFTFPIFLFIGKVK